MSNKLKSLLDRVAKLDAGAATELREQISTLSSRREFGLNFEKHAPERISLVGRPITVGDKVTFVPPRGKSVVECDDTWIVESVSKKGSAGVAGLHHPETGEKASRSMDDLVYVADFRDPIYPGLRSTGKVKQGGAKPFHCVINAENFLCTRSHALQFPGKGRSHLTC